jgi:hypothetical protein
MFTNSTSSTILQEGNICILQINLVSRDYLTSLDSPIAHIGLNASKSSREVLITLKGECLRFRRNLLRML